jgi:hypothetical protein
MRGINIRAAPRRFAPGLLWRGNRIINAAIGA